MITPWRKSKPPLAILTTNSTIPNKLSHNGHDRRRVQATLRRQDHILALALTRVIPDLHPFFRFQPLDHGRVYLPRLILTRVSARSRNGRKSLAHIRVPFPLLVALDQPIQLRTRFADQPILQHLHQLTPARQQIQYLSGIYLHLVGPPNSLRVLRPTVQLVGIQGLPLRPVCGQLVLILLACPLIICPVRRVTARGMGMGVMGLGPGLRLLQNLERGVPRLLIQKRGPLLLRCSPHHRSP